MKLEKVLTYQKGKSPLKGFVSQKQILYLTPEYLRGNSAPNYISDFPGKVEVEDGDLLLLWDGSNAGEFFIGKNGVLSSTMVKFKFNLNDYNREFLFYQLKGIEGYLKSQTKQNTSNRKAYTTLPMAFYELLEKRNEGFRYTRRQF